MTNERLEFIIFHDDLTELDIPERLELAVEISALKRTVETAEKLIKDSLFDHIDEAENKKIVLVSGWSFGIGNRPKYDVPQELTDAKKDIEEEIKRQRTKKCDGLFVVISAPK